MVNQNNNDENRPFWNKVLYRGMNGKEVTLWKFILGIILVGGGIFIVIKSVL